MEHKWKWNGKEERIENEKKLEGKEKRE